MRFPQHQRLIYGRNPLAEVICQVRYPRILEIEKDVPAAFQNRIRTAYPDVREVHALHNEVVRLVGGESDAVIQRSFDFVSKDGVWKVSLSSGFLALSTNRYERWEEFRRRMSEALLALEVVYQVTVYSRIGLRYRDVIRRATLGLVGKSWSKLLRQELLGELLSDGFEEATLHAARELVLKLDFDDASVRLFHGLARIQEDVEACYLIDSDVFREKETEQKNAEGVLDRFHDEAGRLFRWCISDDLHNAMEPTKP